MSWAPTTSAHPSATTGKSFPRGHRSRNARASRSRSCGTAALEAGRAADRPQVRVELEVALDAKRRRHAPLDLARMALPVDGQGAERKPSAFAIAAAARIRPPLKRTTARIGKLVSS
jgi:hypothetical protein